MARARTSAETSARSNVTIATRLAITSPSAGQKAVARKGKDHSGAKPQKKMQPQPKKRKKKWKHGQQWKRSLHLQKHLDPEQLMQLPPQWGDPQCKWGKGKRSPQPSCMTLEH